MGDRWQKSNGRRAFRAETLSPLNEGFPTGTGVAQVRSTLKSRLAQEEVRANVRYNLLLADAPRRKEARSTAAPFAASRFADFSCSEIFFASETPASNDMNLGQAVESKKRDNTALGETLVRIGLLDPRELSEIRSSQGAASDLVRSLMVASAIRTRLGEILLQEKRITSSQLEHALELQRQQGGKLGEILVGLGWLDEATLDAALATQAAQRTHRPE